MSTKRLSRTIVEAGQWRFRWHYTRCASRSERTEARVRTKAATRGLAHDDVYIRPRTTFGKWFAADKLGAVERWLHAQVGRPWAKVEGEIRSRFDVRSLAAHHIVFDHLLPNHQERPETGWVVNHRFEFHVDKHGILRARPRVTHKKPGKIRPATIAWLAGRRIGLQGTRAFWLLPVAPSDPRNTDPRFRQAARLDASELERLAQLNPAEREAHVVVLSPARPSRSG